MGILVNSSEEVWRVDKYRVYLDSIKDRLPSAARRFATADWHYNPDDPRCPHDGRVREIKISELAKGRNGMKSTQIEILLVGAYHDRLLRVSCKNVTSHSISYEYEKAPKTGNWLKKGYGDWLIDEIKLTRSGKVLIEIQFERAYLKAECTDVVFQDRLTSTPYSANWALRK